MRWKRDDGAYGMPGSNTRWAAVTTVASGFEADVVVAVLGAAGIPARAHGNDFVGLFGPNFQGPTAHGVDVLVPVDALDEARGVLQASRDAAADAEAADAEGSGEAPDDAA